MSEVDRLGKAAQHLHLFQLTLQFVSRVLLPRDVYGDAEHRRGFTSIVVSDLAS